MVKTFRVEHDVTLLYELVNPRAGNVQRHATVRLQTQQTNELKEQTDKQTNKQKKKGKREKNEKKVRENRDRRKRCFLRLLYYITIIDTFPFSALVSAASSQSTRDI